MRSFNHKVEEAVVRDSGRVKNSAALQRWDQDVQRVASP